MKNVDEKYRRAIDVLKRSRPVLTDAYDIEGEVISKITLLSGKEKVGFSVFDFLFGWTEIVWIRRSLITVSFVLVAIFVYQQSMIVKQLNWLSTQIGENQEQQVHSSFSEYSGRLKLLKISGRGVQQKNSTVSEEQLDMILKSLDKLQTDYENLMKILNENPELKELVDKKLDDIDYKKIKL
ncbi:MAG TPA: hypothetical protein VMV47_03005 [Bacteroidales bacterium]|nr:hypothetical protein [Bacteroidales bacterium]